jgi:hypothetical protein
MPAHQKEVIEAKTSFRFSIVNFQLKNLEEKK